MNEAATTAPPVVLGDHLSGHGGSAGGEYSRPFEGGRASSSGPTFVDLFCGAGGFSAGLVLAGWRCIAAFDKDLACIETHRRNFPRSTAEALDLVQADPRDLLPGPVDLVVGSPPCQTFSSIGVPKILSLEGSQGRLRDDPLLFRHFFRWIDAARPKVFVLENVPQFLTKAGRAIGSEALERGRALGYRCEAAVVDAAEFGVPQRRRRAFIVGVRDSLGAVASPLARLRRLAERSTVRDALWDLPTITDDWRMCDSPYARSAYSEYAQRLRTATGIVSNNRCRVSNERAKRVFPHLRPGMQYSDLPADIRKILPFREDIFQDRLKRLVPDEPSWTVIAHIGMDGYMYIHPWENRTLSVREAARLQSFPDAFHIVGNMRQQYVQVGNAVAPLMAKALGSSILEVVQ